MIDHLENRPIYDTPGQALDATSQFYTENGFSYTDSQVADLLRIYLQRIPKSGNVLDLCCGDGVWSQGIQAINPKLTLFGIDISPGAIESARRAVPDAAANFVVGDAEQSLPWPKNTFDLIFARGPGLFNQHSMEPHAVATDPVLPGPHRHTEFFGCRAH